MNKLMQGNDTWIPLLGRILIGLLFIPAGIFKALDISGTASYAATAFFIPEGLATMAVIVAIIIEIVVTLMIVLGLKTRCAALVLALFTLLVTIGLHQFWTIADEGMKQAQQAFFFKNLAISGGLLYIWAYGAGKLSLDAKK
jgi:putative oxidoreductase